MDAKGGKKKGKKDKKVDLDNLKRELEMVNIHHMLITFVVTRNRACK